MPLGARPHALPIAPTAAPPRRHLPLAGAVRGSFDSALGAMRNLREVGIAIAANTQINRHSLGELESIFDVLAGERLRG